MVSKGQRLVHGNVLNVATPAFQAAEDDLVLIGACITLDPKTTLSFGSLHMVHLDRSNSNCERNVTFFEKARDALLHLLGRLLGKLGRQDEYVGSRTPGG